jgi:preprotein translocase subunit YajC
MFSFILLQAGGQGMAGNLILIVGIIVIFYFFMIRPQQKRQKEQKGFIESIKKGEDVVTIGGLHGKVYAVEDDSVILEVDKGVKMKFDKTAISLEASKKSVKK